MTRHDSSQTALVLVNSSVGAQECTRVFAFRVHKSFCKVLESKDVFSSVRKSLFEIERPRSQWLSVYTVNVPESCDVKKSFFSNNECF